MYIMLLLYKQALTWIHKTIDLSYKYIIKSKHLNNCHSYKYCNNEKYAIMA